MPRRLCKGCDRYSIPADAPKTCKACSIPCSIVIGKKLVARQRAMQERSRAKQAKAEKQESTRRKKEFFINDYSHQFDLTKKAAQKLANALDRDLRCISCDCVRGVQFCGGHFRTVGAHRELALDLRNIHGQCNRNCNMGLSGNIGGTKKTRGFRAGLVERFGQAFVDFLESAHKAPKPTCEQLIQLRAEYAAEFRRIMKGLPPSRDWRALPEQQQAAA